VHNRGPKAPARAHGEGDEVQRRVAVMPIGGLLGGITVCALMLPSPSVTAAAAQNKAVGAGTVETSNTHMCEFRKQRMLLG
jgi:hypothetical protein